MSTFSTGPAEDIIENSLKVAGQAFSETFYFLLSAIVVYTGGLLVGYLLVKAVDRHAPPFLAWRPGWVKPLPLVGTTFVLLSTALQIFNTCVQFFTVRDEIGLAKIALTNAVAHLGMEVACLVVFGGLTVIATLLRGHGEVSESVNRRRSLRLD